MKTYILVVATIILAIAGSVFAKGIENTHDDLYYWYQVDEEGFVQSDSEAFLGAPKSVNEAQSQLPCESGDDADCIRGFAQPIMSFPTNAVGDISPLQKKLH